MAYVTDIVAKLMNEVLEYVGEIEHGEDLADYQNMKLVELKKDFAAWLEHSNEDPAPNESDWSKTS